MAAIVHLDIIDGIRAEDTQFDFKYWRKAKVSGLTGETALDKILEAETAVGMPQIGDLADAAFPLLRLWKVTPQALAGDTMTLILEYGQNRSSLPVDEKLIEVGTTLTQSETNKDINDNLISVQYTYPAGYNDSEYPAGEAITQGGLASKFLPNSQNVFHRHENSSPGDISKAYVGKVNSQPWEGGDARSWLCTGITGRSNDGGSNYNVTYTFQYRDETWDSVVYFVDPREGKPPADLVVDTGIKTYQIYNTIDFNDLDLV